MNSAKLERVGMLQAAEDASKRCVQCGNLTGRKDLSLCQNCSEEDVAKIFPQLVTVGVERLSYENQCDLLTETARLLGLHDPFLFRLTGLKGHEKRPS